MPGTPFTRTVFNARTPFTRNSVYLPEKRLFIRKLCYLPEKRLFIRKLCLFTRNSVLLPGNCVFYPKQCSFTGKQWSFTRKCVFYRDSESGHVSDPRLYADGGYLQHPFVTFLANFDILTRAVVSAGAVHGYMLYTVVVVRVVEVPGVMGGGGGADPGGYPCTPSGVLLLVRVW